MTSKERVLRTLEFNGPDKIPMDLWVLPAATMRHGEKLDQLCEKYELDIVSMNGPLDQSFTPEHYVLGDFIDPWGSQWRNLQEGIIGEVKAPVFADYAAMKGYKSPTERFLKEWEEYKPQLEERIRVQREKNKFITGGSISLFERMQYLRGTEDLYCDIALEEDELFELIELTMEYMEIYLGKWLEMDIDAFGFADDWGSQISLLISPDAWRKLFKPHYKKMIDRVKAAGKKVFFHSDGYIFDLYSEFIELGVDAVNSQLWCMGVEKVAAEFAGKITFWGEVSRQDILPYGTPEDVTNAVHTMVEHLYKNGGLIGQSEVNRDVSLENIEALLNAWNDGEVLK